MNELDELDWFGNRCSSCNKEKINLNWCRTCNAKLFRQDFKNWTSGNSDIDKFLQESQLSAEDDSEVLEWVPYERFQGVDYIARGGFGSVYKAKWIDGLIRSWDDKAQNWERIRQNIVVALKSLDDSEDVSLDFIREITFHKDLSSAPIIRSYGITQDPETKNYMMVLEFAEDGSLRDYLNKNKDLTWRDKIRTIYNIALGLDKIHENEIIHRDLHSGNILMHNNQACITDMGLCRPVSADKSKDVYGVPSYIAPEVIRMKGYTKAADIYSFGILIYQIISGLLPYCDIPENQHSGLILKICRGLRPKFDIEVPQLILDLKERCLDEDPLKRPTASMIKDLLCKWWKEIEDNLNNPMNQSALNRQIKETDRINSINSINSTTDEVSSSPSKKIHSETTYTSKPIVRSSEVFCASDKISEKESKESTAAYSCDSMDSLRIINEE